MTEVTLEDLEAFIQKAQVIFDSKERLGEWVLVACPIRTWWCRIADADAETGAKRSVFCFVDMRNGNVLYPASWAGPVRTVGGIRGNIFSDDELGIRWHGAARVDEL